MRHLFLQEKKDLTIGQCLLCKNIYFKINKLNEIDVYHI